MPYARIKNELPIIPGYAAGDIVTIEAAAAPLNKCVVYILPVQSGTGDPSPSNVRPITGHTELNLVQKDGSDTLIHTYTTDLGTTVYGGTLDVVSGVLTIDRAIVDLSTFTLGTLGDVYIWYKAFDNILVPESNSEIGQVISEYYAPIRFNGVSGTPNTIAIRTNAYMYVNTCGNTTPQCNAVYKLATPTTTQLTPQEINTILGQNIIFADSGNIDIIYIRRNDS